MSHGSTNGAFAPMRVVVGASLFALVAMPASAQAPPVVEASGGYALLAHGSHTLPLGAFGAAGWHATPWVALIGEVAVGFEESSPAARLRTTERMRTLMGGARLTMARTRRLDLFADVLAGSSLIDVRVWDPSPPADSILAFDVRLDSTDFAVQTGAGLTWWTHSRMGVRIDAHYRRVFDRFDLGPQFPGHTANEFELLAGAAMGFGRRR